ncbi:MAG: PAS domain-containing sensor histidine kinase, partial [Terriglobales bacterium]
MGLMVLFQNADLPLRHSNQMLRAIFDASRDGILVSDQKVILYANRSLARLFGYRGVGEMLGQPIADLLPQHEREILGTWRARRLQGEATPDTFPFTGLRRDGTLIRLEAAVSLAEIAGQRLMVGVVRDITERHQAVQKVVETSQTLEAVLRASPLAVIALDPGDRVQIWNPAAERIFGWKAAEVLGQPAPIVPAAERRRFDELRRQVLEGDELLGVEVTRCRRDGSLLDMTVSSGPTRDERGITGTMEVLEDISGRRQLERQLEQSRKMEALGRLAAGVAHDFNNLLTAVLLYSGLMAHYVARGSRPGKHLEEIRRAAERGAALVTQLLAYTRQQVAEPRVLNLNALIAGISGMLQRLVGEDVELQTRCAADLGAVRADPAQMEQVILTLAANARDAMPGGGRLLLETANRTLRLTAEGSGEKSPPGAWVLLLVKDAGVGMDAATRAAAFDPFFTTKERGKGSGLGLASVRALVQQAGGHIEMESEAGKGTTVSVYLPRVDEGPEERAPEASA